MLVIAASANKQSGSRSAAAEVTWLCLFPRYADHVHKFHENGDTGDMWQ